MSHPSDIQKELEQLIREKFGSRLNILSTTITTSDGSDLKDEPKGTHPPDKDDATAEDRDNDFHLRAFNKTPKEVKHYLDQYVISQDEAKKTLAIAICNHYNQILHHHRLSPEAKEDYIYAKQNVLLIGPTGVGKTYMIRQIAKLIDVPFVRADATKYSETGYVGGNVEDMIRDLVHQADDDITRAEYGIVYIDEADKLATTSQRSHDISGRGVQLNLLKLLEETEVDLRGGHDPVSQIQTIMEMHATGGGRPASKVINTKHILFILSGSFNGLAEIIAKRKSLNTIGFAHDSTPTTASSPPATDELLAQLKTEDLIKFGYEPEFVGRLPVRVFCRSLSVDDLFQILKTAQGNIVNQYCQALAAYDITATFKDSAFTEIAKQAYLEKTGARSLSTILDQSLKDFIYELPSVDVDKLTIDGQLIRDPQTVLATILAQAKPKAPRPPAQPHDKQAKDATNSQGTHGDKAADEEPGASVTQDELSQLLDPILYHQIKDSILAYPRYFLRRHGICINFDGECTEFLMHKFSGDTEAIQTYLNDQLQNFETTIKLVAYLRDATKITLSRASLEDPETTFQQWIQTAIEERETRKKPKSPRASAPTTSAAASSAAPPPAGAATKNAPTRKRKPQKSSPPAKTSTPTPPPESESSA